MNMPEIARLLGACAAFDQRTVGDGDVLAWHMAVGDIRLDVAQAAVIQHYKQSDERITPAKLRALASPAAARHPSSAPMPLRTVVPAELAGIWGQRCRDAEAAAKARNVRRREAVLAVPELAARLVTEGGYPTAEHWNGYVPPEHDCNGNRNNSPRRVLLADLDLSLGATA